MLRLSRHILPEVRLGLYPLEPQNLCARPERVTYATALVERARSLIRGGHTAAIQDMREQLPLAAQLLSIASVDGVPSLEVLPDFEDALRFVPERLGVLLRDGRLRDPESMVYVPSGEATAALLRLLRGLTNGVARDALLASPDAEDVGFDAEFLDGLIERGVVELGRPATMPLEDGMTWIGHAYVVAKAGPHAAWFDPYPCPAFTWAPEELAEVFTAPVPDAVLLPDYGPAASHRTALDLPAPSAVFITHQDTDHFALGALGLIDPAIPIYVPAADPARPWQVDLQRVFRDTLGPDRNVQVLRAGDVIELGAMRVHAVPFVGEFPSTLPHQWLVYYVELPNQTWLVGADSAITAAHLRWLAAHRGGDGRPFGLMTNSIHDGPVTFRGYSDSGTQLTSFHRLFSWYVPPAELLAPSVPSGVHVSVLRELVTAHGLTAVYPYAHGNLPWYRMQASVLHDSHVGSHSVGAFRRYQALAAACGTRVAYLRHARGFEFGGPEDLDRGSDLPAVVDTGDHHVGG
jgi:L-ascorbate metabolism protein UlaG (beta-lactamase superfamily)